MSSYWQCRVTVLPSSSSSSSAAAAAAAVAVWLLCLVQTTTRQDRTVWCRLVLSVTMVWTELATSQVCRRQTISSSLKMRCDQSLSCLDSVSNQDLFANTSTPQTGLDKIIQSSIYWGLLKTVLTCRQFCSHHRQERTIQDGTGQDRTGQNSLVLSVCSVYYASDFDTSPDSRQVSHNKY